MDFTATDDASLFSLKGTKAVLWLNELDEAVRLFDRYLGQFSVLVEDVEEIAFCDTFSWQVTY